MSTKIKGTTPPVDTNIPSINESSPRPPKAEAKPLAADSFSKPSSPVTYKSSPLIPSAKMFAGEVNFPSHLIDPRNPKNDRKYRRLLGAILGFGDLEDCFTDFEEELENEDSAFSRVKREEDGSSDSSSSQDQENEENQKN